MYFLFVVLQVFSCKAANLQITRYEAVAVQQFINMVLEEGSAFVMLRNVRGTLKGTRNSILSWILHYLVIKPAAYHFYSFILQPSGLHNTMLTTQSVNLVYIATRPSKEYRSLLFEWHNEHLFGLTIDKQFRMTTIDANQVSSFLMGWSLSSN